MPRAVLVALCGGYFLVLLDVTVVNVALPDLGADLRASRAELAWVVDAYAIPLAALILAAGAIGDRLGHRRIVVIGLIGFGVASAICALAPDVGVLIGGRAVQGVGAALMLPGTLAMIVESVSDPAERIRDVGLWAAVGGVALPAGPLVGGLLVGATEWRAVFWFTVPIICAALVPIARMPGARRDGTGLGGVPWVSAGLLALTVAAAVGAIIVSPDRPTLAVVGTLGAVLALTAFAVLENRSPAPLIEIPRRRRPLLSVAVGVAGLMNLCVIGTLFVLTQFVQGQRALSPAAAGLLLVPAMLPLPVLGTPAALLATRLGPWPTAGIGAGIAAFGFGGIAAWLDHGWWVLAAALLVWGCGIGVLTPAVVAAAMATLPESPGIASGTSNTARQTGGALGVAIFSAVAGAAGSTAFEPGVRWLMIAAGGAFTVAATLCGAIGFRLRDRRFCQ